jgi:hypothetical protein
MLRFKNGCFMQRLNCWQCNPILTHVIMLPPKGWELDLQHMIKPQRTQEWVADCCLMPNGQFFSYTMARTSYIQWNDDVFVLTQHAYLNVYSVSPLRQQFTARHVASHGHHILIQNQTIFYFYYFTNAWIL